LSNSLINLLNRLTLNLHGGVSGDLKEGGAFMYGTGGELPGGDAIVPNGMKSLVDSMLANTQVYFEILHNALLEQQSAAHSFLNEMSGFDLWILPKKLGV
jgi:hypothetical protein